MRGLKSNFKVFPHLKTLITVPVPMPHNTETISQLDNTCAGKIFLMMSLCFSTVALISAHFFLKDGPSAQKNELHMNWAQN